MLFAFGALGALGLFAAVVVGALLLAKRMAERPFSTLLMVGVIAVLAWVPVLLTRQPVHARHPNNAGVQLAYIWMAELQVLYGIPLLVFPFAVVRWVLRRAARPRPASAHRV